MPKYKAKPPAPPPASRKGRNGLKGEMMEEKYRAMIEKALYELNRERAPRARRILKQALDEISIHDAEEAERNARDAYSGEAEFV